MTAIDTLIDASWVIPVEPAGRSYADHAVAIRQGRIVDVLATAEAVQRYQPAERISRPGHVVMPGLVNAHTHAAMTLLRGYADDMPLVQWLREHVWPAEQRWVSESFVHDGTELAIAEMVRGGVTCFNDMYFFPETSARAAARLGMRACIGMIVVEFPTPWADGADECLRRGLALHDDYRQDPLVTTAFAPHSPYAVSDESFARIRLLADQLDVPVHMHLHETAEEIAESRRDHQRRPLARLAELGLVNPALVAVHMTQVDDAEIELCARHGVSVVHCPESNLKLASGLCPVARLLAAGVNVALGTDGAASNNDLDMLAETRTAALLAKGVAGDAAAVDCHTALRMATLNGARALGLGDQIGSIEKSKWADLACVDLGRPATQPVHHPASQLVYAACREQVSDVWVAGRQLLDRGRLTTADVADLTARAAAWAERLAGPGRGGAAR